MGKRVTKPRLLKGQWVISCGWNPVRYLRRPVDAYVVRDWYKGYRFVYHHQTRDDPDYNPYMIGECSTFFCGAVPITTQYARFLLDIDVNKVWEVISNSVVDELSPWHPKDNGWYRVAKTNAEYHYTRGKNGSKVFDYFLYDGFEYRVKEGTRFVLECEDVEICLRYCDFAAKRAGIEKLYTQQHEERLHSSIG